MKVKNCLLRNVEDSDLIIFYENQQDYDSRYMAAFISKEQDNKERFIAHWSMILNDETKTTKTIIFEDQVVGYVSTFQQSGEQEITYWIGKKYWGKGIATNAVSQFINQLKLRPLYARAAKDNIASIRVLEKCGFSICGNDIGFAYARNKEIEEVIMKLI
jgi:RimJ/RimL family protein N-acetyltransferase